MRQVAQLGVASLRLVERLAHEPRPSDRRRDARCASFKVTTAWTRRCWAPSCRSRSMRRRASSAAMTTRAREATSSSRLSAFAIAVATSSVNSAICDSVSGRERRLALRGGGDHAPEPSLDHDRTADRRADSQRLSFLRDWPEAGRSCRLAPDGSSPAPARRCSALEGEPRANGQFGSPLLLQAATAVTVSSDS